MELDYNHTEKLKLAGLVEESIVDGPGIRFVIFTQGCNHKCPGCHNSHTQDFAGGEYMKVDDLIEKIRENPLLDGVTLSGGEPFEQTEALSSLTEKLKKLNYHIIIYTGYTYEEIEKRSLRDPTWLSLIENTDILIDGKFDQTKRNLRLSFRGSENQRIIDVKKTKASGNITIMEI